MVSLKERLPTSVILEKKEHLEGKEVTVAGFVHSIRDQKRMQFIVLRDRYGMLQLTFEKSQDEKIAKTISELSRESVIAVRGRVVNNPIVKLGGVEILIEDLEVLSEAESPLPIDPINENVELSKRLDYRWLDLRKPKNILLFEIETFLERKFIDFFSNRDFIIIHSPKLMATASESGSELFEVEYFGKKAYLAQSPQFYKQMGIASGFERVLEIGPVFRANPSFTSRHDTEFTSFDIEMAFIESHEDLMSLEEELIYYLIASLYEEFAPKILSVFNVELSIPEIPFPRLKLEEALEIVKKEGHQNLHEDDLDSEGEKIVSKFVKKEFSHDFVFITDYPFSARPFYHMKYPGTNVTKSYDLLFKGLEITTGSQREHRYQVLKQQAEEKGISIDSIEKYLDFFRFGCPPHGGFGFGFTRFVMKLLNFENVREVTYVYRGINRLLP